MAAKRAANSRSVRPAFINGSADDEPTAEPASGCDLCVGRWLPDSTFEHDAACVVAGRAVMARRAQRRRDGLD